MKAAIKAISKSVSPETLSHDVPKEILTSSGPDLDLKRWSLFLTDSDLKKTTERAESTYYEIDCSEASVVGMFHNFFKKYPRYDSFVSVNISGAIDVSDFGITVIARNNWSLNELDVTGCIGISDVGLREIGLNCKLLSVLNVSGTIIAGTCLVAIAEGCPHLSKITVSRCQYLQKYGLTKVFYCCKKLEYVNMSHLREMGDNEVRVLALNNPLLTTFIAKETPYVSDQSIMALAVHCCDLEHVNVSRSQLIYKITDASLLALGESCPSVRIVRVNGCDHITDVGMSWLAEGCKYLEDIDISGCVKITDAGLRSLSMCHSLTDINVSKNKLISDIGITSLSVGCPKLRSIVCDGLFLLSDPRLTKTKNIKAGAFNNDVGIAALSQFCTALERLSIVGCFQLNAGIGNHVSSLKLLRSIDFSGCGRLSKTAIINVATSCLLLEDVNLSDCGSGVCNVSLEALGRQCKMLKTVVLARCEGFSSIRTLCSGGYLQKLDLTSCVGCTDATLLPLCDETSAPALTHLSLVNIRALTDQAIAWIAFGCKHIVHLSLKGTKINSFTARAVKDSFPLSTLLQNDNFFGFWPNFRFEDRVLMDGYSCVRRGIIVLQSLVRKVRAKEVCRLRLLNRYRIAASIVVQSCIRVYLARAEVRRRRLKALNAHFAATKLASIFRVKVAKGRARKKREERLRRLMSEMATKIQTQWRVLMDYRWRVRTMQQRRVTASIRVSKAIRIQAFLRQKFAVTRVQRLKYTKRARENLRHQKALLISRFYRGYIARQHIKKLLVDTKHKEQLRQLSVRKIQKLVKVRRLISVLTKRQALKTLHRRSAVKIQSLVRSRIARIHLIEMRLERQEDMYNVCALRIQCRWKIKKAVNLLRSLVEERIYTLTRKAWASTQFAKYWRGRQARLLLQYLRSEAREAELWRAKVVAWAVIKIQSFYRGHLGRKRFSKLMREKRGLWVELFDEAKQRRFFYSKLTGEIRWQMPADLLALIPRPVCDNCSFYEAFCECAFCQEVFCSQCFGQVHYGGRRKEHEFRCLYDYYSNRIDYGDGVYPSKWPSEVIQDEVQGWMLRVAPIRYPTSVIDNWEIYDSEVAIENGTIEQRRFYFNRNTFEATYDLPSELTNEGFSSTSYSTDVDRANEWNQSQPLLEFSYDYSAPSAEYTGSDSLTDMYGHNGSISVYSGTIEEEGSASNDDDDFGYK